VKKYVFKPYNKIFPKLFAEEKARILAHLKNVIAIEHIGSTAIVNLGGKAIIDMAIAVKKEEMNATIKPLESLGYEYRPTFSTPERFYFITYRPDPEEGKRRYHVHLTYLDSEEWKSLIGFRDYLRKHPEIVEEYADLKRHAASESNQEGDKYRAFKQPLFEKIASLISAPVTLKTERLILRPWKQEDLEPFAALNADPRVMEYFPALLSRKESDERVRCWQAKIEARGWGPWAVSVPGVSDFIGFIGLNDVDFKVHFTPAIEIGWRLAHDYWGKGYAIEGARACLKYAFETLGLKEVVSFTAVSNQRSRRVMERIGMHHDPKDDFDHSKLPEGHALRRHVLYRLTAEEWNMKH